MYLYQGSAQLMEIVRNNSAFENITKISLSNSMYALESGVSTHGSISEISLNTNSLKTLKKIFYDKKCKKTRSCAGGYYEFQDIICGYKNITDFQQILDILYLNYIRTNKVESILAKNIAENLTVDFQSFRKCLDDKFGDFEAEHNKDVHLRKYYAVLKVLLSRFEWKLLKEDVFCVLYINLLFELIAYERFDRYEGETHIDCKEKLVKYIQEFITKMTESKSIYAQYFSNAFEEIFEYEQCMENCKMVPCSLPLSDLAYISRKEIEYGSQAYNTFLRLIEKSALEREYSFVLKYINIGGLLLSSGERALLNFFSWMHLVPFFNKISNDVEESLRDNILLLIDEIDLYCHPSWQQKLLKYLIEEVRGQYSGKSVQIIFTTHSPIVLSDMPKSNVIYLQHREGKCYIDDADKHSETFGANIYKLFDDAFFLGKRGQIGEFSKSKIQKIIDEIQPRLENEDVVVYPELKGEEIERLKKEISLIGEVIIRDKLYEMLYSCKYRNLNVSEKKIKIYEEKIRYLRNGE